MSYFFRELYLKSDKEDTTINEPTNVTSSYRMSGNSLEKFDISFLQLENKEQNMIYSPLSIKYALEMLGDGSNDNSKKQIDEVIGDYKSKKYNNSSNMSFANAMFIRDTYKNNISDNYTNTLSTKYNAEIIYDKFENAFNMNKWVSDKTFNLIDDLFDDDTVKQEDFILTNALAIDMKWHNLIQAAATDFKNESDDYNYYSVRYNHEKYSEYIEPIMDKYRTLKFNDNIDSKAVEIGASINNYDIVKTLGEDNIRKTVGDEYRKWLESDEAKLDLEYNPSSVETDVDKFLDKYIEELNENYKRVDASTDFMLYEDESVKAFAKDLREQHYSM